MVGSGARWKTLVAFALIYFVWGSTFLAIRIGVHEVPPLLFAAMRFFTAGVILWVWTLFQGQPWPSGREWLSVSVLAVLIFVVDYGCLFWAEQRVPSGIAAVMLATIPVFTAIAEITLLRTQQLTVRLAFALLLGIAGVAVLVSHSFNLGGAPIDSVGAAALLVGSMSWSLASVLTRRLPQPSSKLLSAGMQMAVGGVFLVATSAALGEFHRFHIESVSRAAWLSLWYMIVAGSLLGFTAYVWLIHRESPTKVGTYAYVNPLVAVAIGYFWGGEPLTGRTVMGTICVLISVAIITTTRAKTAVQAPDAIETVRR